MFGDFRLLSGRVIISSLLELQCSFFSLLTPKCERDRSVVILEVRKFDHLLVLNLMPYHGCNLSFPILV